MRAVEPRTRSGREDLLADGLMTVKEAAAFSKQSPSSLYVSMDAGRLAYVKLGRSRRIPRRALVEYLAANLQGGWASPDDHSIK